MINFGFLFFITMDMVSRNMTAPALENQKIYNTQFWLLCMSSLLFFSSFNMLIPELPAYLTAMGGADYKGLIIALFTLTAGLSRPFSGKLSDRIGRIPVMVFGAVVCFVMGFLYPLMHTVGGFLTLRLFHGLSTGFKPTATSAYVADVVPATRRGEAMGIHGFFSSTGMAIGPYMGSLIANEFGIDALFYTSSMVSILSVLILLGMQETLPNKEPFRWSLLNVGMEDFFDRGVVVPAVVMLFTVFSFGVVLTIVPDLTVHLGFENKGIFFTTFTLASLSCRIFMGRLSDKYGRRPLSIFGLVFLIAGMTYLGFAHDLFSLLSAALLFGFGFGTMIPSIYAWTIDLAEEGKRGRAIATMYISLELGIGLGALISQSVYQNKAANFPFTFWLAAASGACALVYIMWERGKSIKE